MACPTFGLGRPLARFHGEGERSYQEGQKNALGKVLADSRKPGPTRDQFSLSVSFWLPSSSRGSSGEFGGISNGERSPKRRVFSTPFFSLQGLEFEEVELRSRSRSPIGLELKRNAILAPWEAHPRGSVLPGRCDCGENGFFLVVL
jgi:hypothetical protein